MACPVLRPTVFALPVYAVAAASLLGGCSDGRIATSGPGIAAPLGTLDQPATNIGERVASAALDDRGLGEVRGGFTTGSGVVVNFSFEEATYVNHSLAQSIVIPTLTVSPGSNTASMAGGFTSGAVASIGNTAQRQVSSPTQAIQSIINSGMTSIVSNFNKGGISNVVSNTANNQLVQQMITANIGITGLSQAMQQSVASTVMSRVTAANSQFR
jgi:hypothetical protein